MIEASKYERYSRHILLPEIGETGQRKLLDAKVLVIGAGGLGCPVLQYLTAAGVGTIGIADDDVVSLSNLQRQVLYTTEDIGNLKAPTAAYRLQQLNNEVQFQLFETRVTNKNVWDIISDFDIIIDGSDNFSTRYLVNDACVLVNKPVVYGSIFRFEGQVAVFNLEGSTNYRDVFAEPPASGEVPDCAEAGVLGVLPGVIGSMMANETIKLITGTGSLLVNKLLTYNALHNTFYEMEIAYDSKALALTPKSKAELELMNYDESCSVENAANEINADEFNALLTHATVIDVREFGEQPRIKEFKHLHIPLSELKQKNLTFSNEAIVLFCQSGKRSKEAATIIRLNNPDLKEVYSLEGGILKWKNQQKQLS